MQSSIIKHCLFPALHWQRSKGTTGPNSKKSRGLHGGKVPVTTGDDDGAADPRPEARVSNERGRQKKREGN